MSDPYIHLSFLKLNVPQMTPALQFWRSAMGFEIQDTFDEPDFLEHILAIPDQGEDGPRMMLVEFKDGRDVSIGEGHGPVGFITHDVETALEQAVAAGAKVTMPVTEVAPRLRIAKFVSPQGHEAELVHRVPDE